MHPALTPSAPILLVDDERAWLRSMSLTLERQAGLNNLLLCSQSAQVMDIVRSQDISLIMLDLTMPPPTGEEVLAWLQQNYPLIPVLVISGLNQVDSAVQCMKHGAFDYYVKTDDSDRILTGVQRALRMRELERENEKLRVGLFHHQLEQPQAFAEIRTRNPQMTAIFQYVEAVAPSSQPVLIIGESGTGKELIARSIHRLGRPQGPWVAVNAAGVDENVFADTLFGHVKGAFTGADKDRPGMIEEASGGTLFLDEIGDLSSVSQVKLLRLLQEGEYIPLGADRPQKCRARIVAATNNDLHQQMSDGTFRRDLFFRLGAHQVQLPPLRKRCEDLPLLLDQFLEEAAVDFGKKKPTPPEELTVLLSNYLFPGNVRELRAMVFDAVGLHQSGKLSMSAFKKAINCQSSDSKPSLAPISGDSPRTKLIFSETLPTLEEAGALLVEEAMRRSEGNQTIAAGLLGISRPALSKRLKKQRE